uniref:broad substrate specificity ATP-binding cassette transporter ABCG2-like n=1 Tax=Styela clava TaxID=7725 RepID=UPI0019395C76|nr:broad substrate specificity ATP-binding cassette transporter ABCG2-like [Styela clava]
MEAVVIENIAVVPEEETDPKTSGSVMSFHKVSYTVEVKKPCGFCRRSEKIVILSDISGVMPPGLNAIMGPTGSGKSSLLDVLANRKDPACCSGVVLLDGQPIPKNFRYLSGYVVQNDLLVPTASVRETLWFCANLRLPTSISQDDKRNRIDNLLKNLGLLACADTKVGNEIIRGISGGEKKRTSIAIELLLEPKILFLDEPTTGLDSATALSVMILLKRLGEQGHTIVCSIHQPRYSIYKLFDSLTLLSDGELVYHGDATNSIQFFENLGYICETHDNPADFFLDILNGDHKRAITCSSADGKSVEVNKDITNILKTAYKENENAVSLQEKLNKIEEAVYVAENNHGQMYATSFRHQTKILIRRTAKNMVRHPQSLLANTATNVVIGLVIGLIYFQLDKSPDIGVQNRLGSLFFISANLLMRSMLVINTFSRDQAIFRHEQISGYYSVPPYFISKIIADLIPLCTISPIILSAISYWMVGFKAEPGAFFTFLLTVILTSYGAVATGIFYSASLTPNIGSIMLMLTFVFSILFSGAMINVGSVMPWLSWLQYLSLARYSLVALAVNEMRGQIFFSCTNSTSQPSPPTGYYGSVNYTGNINENMTICVSVKGEEYLHTSLNVGESAQNITNWDMWQNHVAMCCIIVGLHILTYIQLARRRTYS